MKLVAALLALALVTLAAPSALAAIDPEDLGAPVCVGYEWCYQETRNGFAIFCFVWKGNWVCGECEACGNEPWLP